MGCHLFKTKNVSDIFLAGRETGINSVYAGGSANYSEITTPDFHYSGEPTDEVVFPVETWDLISARSLSGAINGPILRYDGAIHFIGSSNRNSHVSPWNGSPGDNRISRLG